MITTAGGTFVGSVTANPDTGYTISLRQGTYIVDTLHQGVGGSNLPKTVTIRAGETVTARYLHRYRHPVIFKAAIFASSPTDPFSRKISPPSRRSAEILGEIDFIVRGYRNTDSFAVK